APSKPYALTLLLGNSATSSSARVQSAGASGSLTPTSTNSSPTKPERTFRVRLQEPRRPLAVFPLRLPIARSSVSRLYKKDDAARSRQSRSRRTRAGTGADRADRACAHVAAARRCCRTLHDRARATSRGHEPVGLARLGAGIFRQGQARH